MDGFALHTTDAVAQTVTQISNTFEAKNERADLNRNNRRPSKN